MLYIFKCLQNGGHFVEASVCYWMVLHQVTVMIKIQHTESWKSDWTRPISAYIDGRKQSNGVQTPQIAKYIITTYTSPPVKQVQSFDTARRSSGFRSCSHVWTGIATSRQVYRGALITACHGWPSWILNQNEWFIRPFMMFGHAKIVWSWGPFHEPFFPRILTHWGRDKWSPFHRRYIQMYFLELKCMNFAQDFTEVFFF